jgi:hypothetical protein
MVPQQLVDAEMKLLLGLYTEAEDLVDALPPGTSESPRATVVKLMICEARGEWSEGEKLAEGITMKCSANERQAAGRFLLALAMARCGAGEFKGARAAVVALCRVWPEGKHLALGSKELAVLW